MLGALVGLIQAHKSCLTVDKEAVAAYDTRLKEERKKATDESLYYAALFLLYLDKAEKAREYVDRLLKINPNSVDGLNLKGWVEVKKYSLYAKYEIYVSIYILSMYAHTWTLVQRVCTTGES